VLLRPNADVLFFAGEKPTVTRHAIQKFTGTHGGPGR
jgi:hypothetical protein